MQEDAKRRAAEARTQAALDEAVPEAVLARMRQQAAAPQPKLQDSYAQFMSKICEDLTRCACV